MSLTKVIWLQAGVGVALGSRVGWFWGVFVAGAFVAVGALAGAFVAVAVGGASVGTKAPVAVAWLISVSWAARVSAAAVLIWSDGEVLGPWIKGMLHARDTSKTRAGKSKMR